MSKETVDPTGAILMNEAKMLAQMINQLDEQLQEIEFNRLKLVTVRDALIDTLGISVEQLELPLNVSTIVDEGSSPEVEVATSP
tara:strand:+ start:340 stop:591 length:252 start_codon:yes stop_codon:yes gene_type:complete